MAPLTVAWTAIIYIPFKFGAPYYVGTGGLMGARVKSKPNKPADRGFCSTGDDHDQSPAIPPRHNDLGAVCAIG